MFNTVVLHTNYKKSHPKANNKMEIVSTHRVLAKEILVSKIMIMFLQTMILVLIKMTS